MKEYMMFAGYNYYPSGGANDFVGYFDSIDACENFFHRNKNGYEWWHATKTSDMLIADGNYWKGGTND